MFAIVTFGILFGMFTLAGIGMIAFLDVALQPAPEDPEPEFVRYTGGQRIQPCRIPEMPKTHVA